MKNRLFSIMEHKACLATFGGAQLIDEAGEVYLEGGSPGERVEALEWASLCLPDKAVRLRAGAYEPCFASC